MPPRPAEPFYYDDTPEADDADLRAEAMVWSEGEWRALKGSDTDGDRQSWVYRNKRDEFRKWCEVQPDILPDGTRVMGKKCWLCNKPIDYRLPYPHPDCWSLDHKIPVADRPDLFLDENNWEAAHLDCNKRRGTDEPHLDLGVPSRIW